MRGHLDGQYGGISIDSEVIAKYAGSMAVECFGIVGMAAVSMKDGLVKLLKGDSLTRGIRVEIDEENRVELDFHVIVSYGISIATVADNLVESVKYKVHEFTGLEVKKINIFVEGVRVIDYYELLITQNGGFNCGNKYNRCSAFAEDVHSRS